MATSISPETSQSTAKPSSKVEPQEVGWMFVPQYYSLLNKDPGRLHCFYQKRSTLIHSVEGEESETRYGQQEIHDRIMELGFEDAKVYVSNVDSQPSADGGIIVQVIGEMSNRAGAWRKFAQTFFLAEQPNGYFVLNDIFRFIKEDQDSGDEQTAPTSGVVSAAPQESPAMSAPSAQQHSFQQPTSVAAPSSSQAPAQPSYDFTAQQPPQQPRALAPRSPSPQAPTQAAEESSRPQVNGWHEPSASVAAASAPSPPPARASSPPSAQAAPVEAPEHASATADVAAPAAEAAPASSAPADAETNPAESSSSLAQPAPQAATPAQQAAPAAPAARSAAKPSWASLAANASGTGSKWSSAVVSGHSGVVSAAPPQSARAEPQASTPAPSTSATPGVYNHQRQPFDPASITTGQCFVKGVLDSLDIRVLRSHLQDRFGTVKELDIIRGKACAFLEFATVESAREAIRVSQPVREGGEGGIPVLNTGHTVHVEIRRSKDEVAAYQASRNRALGFDGSSRGGFGGDRGRGGARGGRGGSTSRPPANSSSGSRAPGSTGGPSGTSSGTPSGSGQPRVPRA